MCMYLWWLLYCQEHVRTEVMTIFCMYLYVRTSMSACIHEFICIYISMYLLWLLCGLEHARTRGCVCLYVCIYIYKQIYVSLCIHASKNAYVYVSIRIWVLHYTPPQNSLRFSTDSLVGGLDLLSLTHTLPQCCLAWLSVASCEEDLDLIIHTFTLTPTH